jgi:hypothetical protein
MSDHGCDGFIGFEEVEEGFFQDCETSLVCKRTSRVNNQLVSPSIRTDSFRLCTYRVSMALSGSLLGSSASSPLALGDFISISSPEATAGEASAGATPGIIDAMTSEWLMFELCKRNGIDESPT